MSETLTSQFSDCQLDIIDIRPLITQNWWILGVNAIQTVLLFARELLTGKKNFREAFWRTPFMFKTVRKLLAKKLKGKNYWFTFQMQSLFDCSLPNTPHFVYTDHTHLANLSYPGFDPDSLYKNWVDLEKQIYQKAAINFVRSTNIRKSLIEQYQQPPEKAICVYAGSNVEFNDFAAEGKTYEGQNVLFVGMDWERKGGPDLIEAFKLVQEKIPEASLTIIGASPKIRLPNCRVVGEVSPSELVDYYKSATVFCMPTRKDPFGIVYVEAMQAALPIVATNIGAIPDFIQNDWNGFLVEPGDILGIASGLIKLLKDESLCRLFGKRSLQLVRERYTRQAVGEKIHKYITEYLGEGTQAIGDNSLTRKQEITAGRERSG